MMVKRFKESQMLVKISFSLGEGNAARMLMDLGKTPIVISRDRLGTFCKTRRISVSVGQLYNWVMLKVLLPFNGLARSWNSGLEFPSFRFEKTCISMVAG